MLDTHVVLVLVRDVQRAFPHVFRSLAAKATRVFFFGGACVSFGLQISFAAVAAAILARDHHKRGMMHVSAGVHMAL